MIKTFPRVTTMGAAFLRAAPGPRRLTTMCVEAMGRGSHITRVREWNASLSYGTAMALKKQGVL